MEKLLGGKCKCYVSENAVKELSTMGIDFKQTSRFAKKFTRHTIEDENLSAADSIDFTVGTFSKLI